MHGKDALFMRKQEVEHGKDSFLDFTGIAGPSYQNHFLRKVADNEIAVRHAVYLGVGRDVWGRDHRAVGRIGGVGSGGTNKHSVSEHALGGRFADDADRTLVVGGSAGQHSAHV